MLNFDKKNQHNLLEYREEWGYIKDKNSFAFAYKKSIVNNTPLNFDGKFPKDLHGLDLRQAVLLDKDLELTDLRGTDLRGARLRGARLQGAKLQEADLRGASMLGADLKSSELHKTTLHINGFTLSNWDGANTIGTKFIDDYEKDIPPEKARLILKADAKEKGYSLQHLGIMTTNEGAKKVTTALLVPTVISSVAALSFALSNIFSDKSPTDTLLDNLQTTMCADPNTTTAQTVQDVCDRLKALSKNHTPSNTPEP